MVLGHEKNQKLMDKLSKVFEAVSKLIELDTCAPSLKTVYPAISLSTDPNPLSQEGKSLFKEVLLDFISTLKQELDAPQLLKDPLPQPMVTSREDRQRLLFDKMGFA